VRAIASRRRGVGIDRRDFRLDTRLILPVREARVRRTRKLPRSSPNRARVVREVAADPNGLHRTTAGWEGL
jgi:hypothetical protein